MFSIFSDGGRMDGPMLHEHSVFRPPALKGVLSCRINSSIPPLAYGPLLMQNRQARSARPRTALRITW